MRLSWLGYVKRMEKGNIVKKMYIGRPGGKDK